ncbi:MAG: hypothetical protein FWD27_06000 [Coriobacteriia bacterium]|nr:hypothetical protein [Coriobacteriia bacterium]
MHTKSEQLAKGLAPDTPQVSTRPLGGKEFTRRTLVLGMLIALAVAGLAAALASAQNASQLAETDHALTFALRGGSLDEDKTQQVLESSKHVEDVPSYVLWEQRNLEYVHNNLLNRGAEVNVLLAEGNVGLLFAGASLPQGESLLAIAAGASSAIAARDTTSTPSVAIKEGAGRYCIIDTKTALALFGDVDVFGLSIYYGEEDFTVAAVVTSARPFFLIRPTKDTGVAFDMVTVSNLSAQSLNTLSMVLLSRLGLSGELLDYTLLRDIASILCWLPLLLLGSIYLIFLLLQGFSRKNTSRQQVIFMVGFLVGFLALCYFATQKVPIPRELIPSKISDFSLWQQIFSQKGAALGFLIDAPIYVPQAHYYGSFFLAIALCALSLALFLGAVWLLAQLRIESFMFARIREQRKLLAESLSALRRPRLKNSSLIPVNSLLDEPLGRRS